MHEGGKGVGTFLEADLIFCYSRRGRDVRKHDLHQVLCDEHLLEPQMQSEASPPNRSVDLAERDDDGLITRAQDSPEVQAPGLFVVRIRFDWSLPL